MRYRLSLSSFPVALVCAFGLAALHPSSALAQWTQKQELIASDGVYSDYFGFALAVSGDTAVVGSYASDVSSVVDAGAAYVFMFDGTQWVQKQKLTASDGAQSDNFGVSVAIDGT
jgi:nucleoside-specific outer membrane channel protein Tsx